MYYFAVAILQLALAMLLAVVLSYKVKFPNLWKGLVFFPYLVNGVAIGFIFLYFYKQNGTLDTILNFFHLDSWIKLWLGNRSTNNWAIAMTSLWRYTGYNFLLFFGAIQSVDPEIYEAADMDGANKWQQFRYIMFPAIREIFLVNVILSVSGCLSAFDTPYIMTNGANGTSTFVIQTINTAELAEYPLWLADYRSQPGYTGTYSMWQYSATGNVSGVTGACDLNYSYQDFLPAIRAGNFNGYGSSGPDMEPVDGTQLIVFGAQTEYFYTANFNDVVGYLPVGRYPVLQKSTAKFNGYDWVIFRYQGGEYWTAILGDRNRLETTGTCQVELAEARAKIDAAKAALE